MRQGVTAEQIKAAADAIAAEGQSPTIRAVRERLGTGSPNTIQRHLSQWRESRPQVTQAAYELPAELVNAFGKELRRGAEAATADLRAELAEAHTEAKDLAETGEALENQIDELTGQAEALTHERDTAAADAAARVDQINGLADQLKQAQGAAEAARTEVATARVKIETQADQLAEIKSQWGEQVASLKAEIGRYHERLEVVRDTAQQAQQAAAVAESRTQAQADKADDLKSQVADLKTELSGLKGELSESRKEAKAVHQATTDEAEEWRKTVALEHKRSAELQSERDALADEVANLKKQSGVSANEKPTK